MCVGPRAVPGGGRRAVRQVPARSRLPHGKHVALRLRLPSQLLSRRTGSNTIHGACHVKQGIRYVAQRWIRWHTTQTPGFNPLQRALDQSHHLSRSLQEQGRIAAASGSDQTKHLLTKVTNYESNIHSLKKELDQLKRTTQDLNTRIRDLGDSVPLHVTPSNRASLWRTWVTSSVLFLPVLNNIL